MDKLIKFKASLDKAFINGSHGVFQPEGNEGGYVDSSSLVCTMCGAHPDIRFSKAAITCSVVLGARIARFRLEIEKQQWGEYERQQRNGIL